MKIKFKVLIPIIVIFCLLLIAFDCRLKTVEYTIDSSKIDNEVKIALIADLHSCYYGKEQKSIISRIREYDPDIVLIAGDFFDDKLSDKNAKIIIKKLSNSYKLYYVSGNHEWWSGRMYEMFDFLDSADVTVLRGDCDKININGQGLNICGIDDPEVSNYDSQYPDWKQQLSSAAGNISKNSFNILLAHRPENHKLYFDHDFELVLSGHAHGGQWRIPGLLNGLCAPNQGFFPKFAGGLYEFENKNIIVSRGLSRESTRIPRIFNRPELVFVRVK